MPRHHAAGRRFVGVPVASASAAASAAACASATGVTVVVDFNELGGGVQLKCDGSGGGDTAASLFDRQRLLADLRPAAAGVRVPGVRRAGQRPVHRHLTEQRLLESLLVRRRVGSMGLRIHLGRLLADPGRRLRRLLVEAGRRGRTSERAGHRPCRATSARADTGAVARRRTHRSRPRPATRRSRRSRRSRADGAAEAIRARQEGDGKKKARAHRPPSRPATTPTMPRRRPRPPPRTTTGCPAGWRPS